MRLEIGLAVFAGLLLVGGGVFHNGAARRISTVAGWLTSGRVEDLTGHAPSRRQGPTDGAGLARHVTGFARKMQRVLYAPGQRPSRTSAAGQHVRIRAARVRIRLPVVPRKNGPAGLRT